MPELLQNSAGYAILILNQVVVEFITPPQFFSLLSTGFIRINYVKCKVNRGTYVGEIAAAVILLAAGIGFIRKKRVKIY